MEQTAHLQTALLHFAGTASADPDTNRSVGLHSLCVVLTTIGATEIKPSLPTAGLTCLLHLRSHVLQEINTIFSLPLYAATTLTDTLTGKTTPGFILTWLTSNALPRTNTAHNMRAFLLASATTAFCQPDFSLS